MNDVKQVFRCYGTREQSIVHERAKPKNRLS